MGHRLEALALLIAACLLACGGCQPAAQSKPAASPPAAQAQPAAVPTSPPLCLTTTFISVGSPTMAARGRRPLLASHSIMPPTPVQPTSSSKDSAKWIGRARPSADQAGTLASADAMKPFMSVVPRP